MLDVLNEFNSLSILVRLVMAMFFGGVIGLEREIRHRPAGFRTYMLVCVGAALVMMTNEFIVIKFNTPDPARLGAQVISGIGFLGVGTIIITRESQVKGLTTAAGLWACACMGLAIGIGFYQGAVVATILILTITTLMNMVEKKMNANRRDMEVYIEISDAGSLTQVLEGLTERGIYILNAEVLRPSKNGRELMSINLHLRLPKQRPHYTIVEELSTIKGVDCIIPM